MGRPLKTTKAQTVLTITNTNVNGTVTVSQNLSTLSVIAGMSFVVASTVSGLNTGVIYYIFTVTGTNTFTVSSTHPTVQPVLRPTLTTTTGQSVRATINPVDMLYDNPDGPTFPLINTNTYSVVGGNTIIYGRQVLCNVAIARDGVGSLYTTSSNANIFGAGTDFTNSLAVGSYVAVDGGSTPVGFISSISGIANIQLSAAVAASNTFTSVGNAQLLFANQPITLSANIGGLVAGSTYFVKTIANAAAFSVSSSPGGANLGLTNQSVTSYARQDRAVLVAAPATSVSNSAFQFSTAEAGFIVRQKGKQKYLVTGTTSGITGACYTANVANTALTTGTMSIIATYANAATVSVQSISGHSAELFTATSGPIATGDIVFTDAAPAYSSFNTAIAADGNIANAQPYPVVTVGNA